MVSKYKSHSSNYSLFIFFPYSQKVVSVVALSPWFSLVKWTSLPKRSYYRLRTRKSWLRGPDYFNRLNVVSVLSWLKALTICLLLSSFADRYYRSLLFKQNFIRLTRRLSRKDSRDAFPFDIFRIDGFCISNWSRDRQLDGCPIRLVSALF